MNSTKCLVLGIDVSKGTLDYFMEGMKAVERVNNNGFGIKKLLAHCGSAGAEVFIVVESTGKYHRKLISEAEKRGLLFAVVNPKRTRDFAKSLGILAKTDRIDAKLLARYGSKVELSPTINADTETQKLRALVDRREQLVRMLVQEKNRLADEEYVLSRKYIREHTCWLDKQIKSLSKAIKQFVTSSQSLAPKLKILTSFKGIAFTTAAVLLSHMPELGTLSKPHLAALAGLAPYNDDSGFFKGKRRVFGGRANLRQALYMATLVAIRWNSTIKAFYAQLRARNKVAKVAITACMRKTLIIINAMIKNNQEFSPRTS